MEREPLLTESNILYLANTLQGQPARERRLLSILITQWRDFQRIIQMLLVEGDHGLDPHDYVEAYQDAQELFERYFHQEDV